jgi:uncharacterized protein DUF4214
MSRRTVSREIVIVLGFVALTVIMTWPWILHLRDAMSDRGDTYSHSYWLWWTAHQTFRDPLHLFDSTLFFPYKDSLAFSENDFGIGLVFSPLHALGFRPVTVHSVATLMAFVFSGYGMFRLTRTLTGSNGSAWVAGIVFAFIPYRFQRLPHLAAIFAGWIPLTLEALVLFIRERSWKRAIWLGVAFTMNALTCVLSFILTLIPFALSAAFLLVWCRRVRDRDFWIRAGSVFVVVGLVLLWFLFPYYRVHKLLGFTRTADQAVDLSAYPIHWLASSLRNKIWAGLGGKAAIDELMLFPGLLPPLLSVAALLLVAPLAGGSSAFRLPKLKLLIPRRMLLLSLDVLAFIFLFIAFLAVGYGGIHLRLFDYELLRSTHPIRPFVFFLATVAIRLLVARPEVINRVISEKDFFSAFRSNPRSIAYLLGLIWTVVGLLGSFGMNFYFHRMLFEAIPIFRSIRAPARWAMVCYVGLAILAGLGAAQLVKLTRRWRPAWPRKTVYVVLAILILFEQRVAPIEFVHGEVDPDAVTLRLKATPMSAGIVELPAEKDNYAYYRYMLRAADHGRPIVTASSSFAPPIVQEIESLTLMRPIPDRFIELLEQIPTSYLVVHNALLSLESRLAIESVVARGMAAGRIRFINSYGDSKGRDDLYAVTKTESSAQSEAPTPIKASLNPIDDSQFFIRQQYLDILNREPASSEVDKFADFVSGCNGEPGCVSERRISSALDLFRSSEFQETSGFVYRLYKTALGRSPAYVEWSRETGQLSRNRAEAKLSFVVEWLRRADLVKEYPDTLRNVEYVDKLLMTSTQTLSQEQRKALIDDLNNGKTTRAEVLTTVADNPALVKREYNQAFVATCYFNYLKRDPDPEGYNYWSRILKDGANVEAAVIRGFLYSQEYRARFGQP